MDSNAHRKFVHHLHALIVLVLAAIMLYLSFRDRGISEEDFAPAAAPREVVIAEPLFRAK